MAATIMAQATAAVARSKSTAASTAVRAASGALARILSRRAASVPIDKGMKNVKETLERDDRRVAGRELDTRGPKAEAEPGCETQNGRLKGGQGKQQVPMTAAWRDGVGLP